MHKWLLLSFAGLAAAMIPASAQASGDYGCDTAWKLGRAEFGCASQIVLSPGNDSRVNLMLLMRDQGARSGEQESYPDLNWDSGLGHNFFRWQHLRAALYAPHAADQDNPFFGTRCISVAGGDDAFIAAMAENRALPQSERQALGHARAQLRKICEEANRPSWARRDETDAPLMLQWPDNIESKTGKAFLAYLIGAAAFYQENWRLGRIALASLVDAEDPWLSQTAQYMLPRLQLNAAQASGMDQWGDFSRGKNVDRNLLASAGNGFDAYLKTHPNGHYAGSARGLQRRVMWLAGDEQGLARAYSDLMQPTPNSPQKTPDIVEEIDNKLLFAGDLTGGLAGDLEHPILLATHDLMRLRPIEGREKPELTLAILEAQAPKFAGREDLHEFLLANHAFYVAKDMRKVLQLLPDAARQADFSALEFSRQTLRGMALGMLNDRNEAGFWLDMLPGSQDLYQRPTVELGLALNYERNGKLARIFDADSPIKDSMIRKILLQHSAGPDILRQTARNSARPGTERDLALFTLLHKQLLRGKYAQFSDDLALLPPKANRDQGIWKLAEQDVIPLGLFSSGSWQENYPCGSLAKTASMLARNPKNVAARICLGEFYRLNGFDGFGMSVAQPQGDELGGQPGLFPGQPMPRSAIYSSIIADRNAARNDVAYSLYRAIRCYAPTGYSECGGKQAPQSQRKAWFARLKNQYGDTRWAKDLDYYW